MLKNDSFWIILAYLPLFIAFLWCFYRAIRAGKDFKYKIKIKMFTEDESDDAPICVQWIHQLPGVISDDFISCPLHSDGDGSEDISDIVMHLNDDHNWTFMEIANWLDTLPSQPQLVKG